MTLTFQAQCYLAAWERGLPLDGGISHGERLREVKLDYSWDSLARIDAFLDGLHAELKPDPDAFLSDTQNTNLLYLLGFYVGELRARFEGRPARWATWQELLEIDPGMGLFGEGFHSSAVQVAPGIFLPLVSIMTRLFEGPEDKSVAFSAGMELGNPSADRAVANDKALPPVPPQTLVPDFPAAFSQVRAAYRADYLDPAWPEWFAGDPIDRVRIDTPTLMRKGRMVWACLIQANTGLFDGSIAGAPLEVLYDPRGLTPPEDLKTIAHGLFGLRGKQTGHPELQEYADHLENEMTRLFGWVTPAQLTPYPLHASTMFLHTEWLPGRRLISSVFPILISEECPGSVALAPWQVWPQDYFEHWRATVNAPYLEQPGPPPVPPRPSGREISEGERLYKEGLAYWHGTQPVGLAFWRKGRRDEANAVAKWEQAAAKQHYLATCALLFNILDKITPFKGNRPDPVFQQAMELMSAYGHASRVMAEYRLGFVDAAKLHLREDRPYPKRGDQEVWELLTLASRLGDKEANRMLADRKKSAAGTKGRA